MSRKSTTPKSKSIQNTWLLCDQCDCFVSNKENEQHTNDCPPNTEQPTHSFVTNNRILFSRLETRSNEPIKKIKEDLIDNMVFVGITAMRLCGMVIGEAVTLMDCASQNCFIATVWPIKDNSSILLSKNAMEQNKLNNHAIVCVQKHTVQQKAVKVFVELITATKSMQITHEFQQRLSKHYAGCSVRLGSILSVLYYGKQHKLVVKSIVSKDDDQNDLLKQMEELSVTSSSDNSLTFYEITEKTQIELCKNDKSGAPKLKKYEMSKLGGLQNEIKEITALMTHALSDENHLVKPCRGVLLYGQSGTGKTHLMKAIAANVVQNISIVEINSTDLYSKYSGSIDENVKQLFEQARKSLPVLILMDDLETLCTNRSSRTTDNEKRLVARVLSELDTILNSDLRVFVVGATNQIGNIDTAFRRSGRFDREIEISVPNPSGRLEILKIHLGEACDIEMLKQVAYDTHGFVGADLLSLCSTAIMNCKVGENLNRMHFKDALLKVRPSAMREVLVEVPNVLWSDIGGQEKLKLILRQCVEWPLKYGESFTRLGVPPPRGVLMYGPPGCSKTMIAKALATESGLNFIAIKGPELFSKWVGDSEKAIRDLFRKARQVAPSIIFFDEIDALGGERATGGGGTSSNVQERVLAQLLTEMDGVVTLGDVTVLAATNRPDRIDNALLRPGRLDRIVYVPLPDDDTRHEIFKIKMRKMPVKDVNINDLVSRTEGYSGAEVNALCNEAAMMALEEDIYAQCVKVKHFEDALASLKPRTSPALIKMYESYANI